MRGLAYMHDRDRLHQSLGPSSVVLKYAISEQLIWFYCTLFSLHNYCVCDMMAAQFLKGRLVI